jgi:hypothetical protein
VLRNCECFIFLSIFSFKRKDGCYFDTYWFCALFATVYRFFMTVYWFFVTVLVLYDYIPVLYLPAEYRWAFSYLTIIESISELCDCTGDFCIPPVLVLGPYLVGDCTIELCIPPVLWLIPDLFPDLDPQLELGPDLVPDLVAGEFSCSSGTTQYLNNIYCRKIFYSLYT